MATITLDIPNTHAVELREQLLCAARDMSRLLSICTNKDHGNEDLLSPQFICEINSEIGDLTEMAIYIRDTDEVVS
ncbi:MAG: hypothetical protein JAZ15_11080 [Candidatus Thiodiazotropha endolucinida]|nr:hypothetical protein [Candidatus Thiodiazotropha taylori]MCW4313561.1 hypothetical protein [Candidatus Thiodiazotropha taylori]